jgi:hypothetical protein
MPFQNWRGTCAKNTAPRGRPAEREQPPPPSSMTPLNSRQRRQRASMVLVRRSKTRLQLRRLKKKPSERSLLKSEKREVNKNCSRRLKRGKSKRLKDGNALIARRKLESSQIFRQKGSGGRRFLVALNDHIHLACSCPWTYKSLFLKYNTTLAFLQSSSYLQAACMLRSFPYVRLVEQSYFRITIYCKHKLGGANSAERWRTERSSHSPCTTLH